MQGAPDITVIVPALNEQETIREVIARLLALSPQPQVIVVDDGSTDLTPQILSEYEGQITVVTHPSRQGKGTSIRSGLKRAVGEVVVIQDADLEYSPEQIPGLVRPMLEGPIDVVYGTRFSKGLPKDMALPNKIVNVLLAWMTRLLYRQPITDEATCYKAIKTSLLHRMDLQCTGFEFCPEVTAKVSRLGKKIMELPIEYTPRNKEAGKKIRWTDAPIAFWTLLRYRMWIPQADPTQESGS